MNRDFCRAAGQFTDRNSGRDACFSDFILDERFGLKATVEPKFTCSERRLHV
jgi:hypothetical protein